MMAAKKFLLQTIEAVVITKLAGAWHSLHIFMHTNANATFSH